MLIEDQRISCGWSKTTGWKASWPSVKGFVSWQRLGFWMVFDHQSPTKHKPWPKVWSSITAHSPLTGCSNLLIGWWLWAVFDRRSQRLEVAFGGKSEPENQWSFERSFMIGSPVPSEGHFYNLWRQHVITNRIFLTSIRRMSWWMFERY